MIFDRFPELCKQLPADVAELWADAILRASEEFGIKTPEHRQMWLATLCQECMGFTRMAENMNYSAERLAQVWPYKYAVDPRTRPLVPNQRALDLAGWPDRIGSDVYANMNGNGGANTRDGWRFRGRYPCMLTGRNNYLAAFGSIKIPDPSNPDTLLSDRLGMARVSAWFWNHNNLGPIADVHGFRGVSQVWNMGGLSAKDPIGWTERQMWHDRVVGLDQA